MTQPALDVVRERLNAVVHPAFDKPLGELGLLGEPKIEQQKLAFSLTIHAQSESLREELAKRIEAALVGTGVRELEIEWQLKVPMRASNADDPVPGVKNVVLVMSGKGGVGKSTVAANLALALSRAGTRVGLLDADIYGPSVPTMFGISGHPHSEDGKTIEPLQRYGMKLMSIGFMLESDKDAIIWRGPMLQSALMQFLGEVRWGELDYLVLDLPPGTGDVALTLSQRIKTTGAVMVTTPQEVALQDVYKAVSMCRKVNIPILGVVENMSFFIDSAGVRHELFGAGGGEKIAEFAQAPLLGQVPLHPQVRECGDRGAPIVQAAPDHPAAHAFAHIAEALSERIALESFARGGGKAPDDKGPRRLKIMR
ncbi:MAG TPA: Mrp/NBP35 family ATP-binding protein [Polyangiales bacterium]|nr:Mrp/NBP35 family ATP-binding protein [Polyangiales bacterium]